MTITAIKMTSTPNSHRESSSEFEAAASMSATAEESALQIISKRLSSCVACQREVHVSVIIIGIILSVEIVGLYECSYLRVEVAPMDIGRIELA